MAHAHIERGVGVVGKAALCGIELIGRNADIEQHAVDINDAVL